MEISIRHKNKHGDVCGRVHIVDDENLIALHGAIRTDDVLIELREPIQSVIDLANSDERPQPDLPEMEFVCVLKSFCDLPSQVAYFDDRGKADNFVSDRENVDEDWTIFYRYK